jgi:hypothetical protein
MFHAGIGIMLAVLEQLKHLALSWLTLWIVLNWINKERLLGIFKGNSGNMQEHQV